MCRFPGPPAATAQAGGEVLGAATGLTPPVRLPALPAVPAPPAAHAHVHVPPPAGQDAQSRISLRTVSTAEESV